jgi:Yip1 domain
VDFSLQALLALAQRSVTDPRSAAGEVMRLSLPMSVRWMGLALTAVLSALLLHLSLGLLPPEELALLPPLPGPIDIALAQAGAMVLTAALAYQIGRWQGGHGLFRDALLLMVWLQAVLVVVQIVQIVVLLILPPLGNVLGLVGLGLLLWMLTAFIAELHGFKSLGMVFLAMVVTIFAAGFVYALLVAALTGGGG